MDPVRLVVNIDECQLIDIILASIRTYLTIMIDHCMYSLAKDWNTATSVEGGLLLTRVGSAPRSAPNPLDASHMRLTHVYSVQ